MMIHFIYKNNSFYHFSGEVPADLKKEKIEG